MANGKGLKYGFLGIVAVLAAGAGGVYWYYHNIAGQELMPLKAAAIIPQEAILTSYVTTDASSWGKLSQFGTPQAQQLVQQSWQNWQKETIPNTQINYQQDIEPWIGGIMLATLPASTSPNSSNEGGILVIVGIKDKLKALDFANKFKKQPNQTTKETQYQGITLTEVATPENLQYIYAVVGDFLVLANSRQQIEQAIDTWKGKPAYVNKPGVKELLSQNLNVTNSLGQIYIDDYTKLMEQGRVNSPNNSPQLQSAIIGIGVEDKGLHLQAKVQIPPNSSQLTPKNSSNKLPSLFPENTIIFMSGQEIDQQWLQLVKQSQSNPNLDPLVQQVRQAFQSINLNADQEVFPWINREFALGLINVNQGSIGNLGLGVMSIIETSDRQKGEQTLTKFNQIAQSLPFLTIKQTPFQGINLTEWITQQNQVILTYGWLNNNSLVMTAGTSFETVKTESGGTSLEQSKTFQALTSSLPKPNSGYLYIDWEKMTPRLQSMAQMSGNQLPPETQAIINSIQGLAATTTMINSTTSQLDLLLALKPNTIPQK